MVVGGILIFVVGGFDKMTIVAGPLFAIAGVFALLRQTGRLDINTEIPVLIIIGGVLALISRFLPLPAPKWVDKDEGT